VLITHANRRIQPFGQRHAGRDGPAQNDARAVQNDRKLRLRQQIGCRLNCGLTAGGALELDNLGQVDVDHLRPVIARHVDLGRGACAAGVDDDAVQHLGDARGIAHLFLIGNHVLEQCHLLDLLEAPHADGLVRRLRRDQQQRCVVPIGGFHSRHKVGDPRPVLGDHHRHLARSAGVTIRHHPARAFMGAIPEGDPCAREQIGNRHEGRADDPEGMFDPVHLKDFDKSLFRGHPHGVSPETVRCFRSSTPRPASPLGPDATAW
jgi:hypothetical protein